MRKGEDPGARAQQAAAERRRMPTVAEFAVEYVERYARPNKKSWDEDRRALANWVTPRIGRLKLDAVHRRDIAAVLDACRDAGNVRMPGSVLAVTRRMFRFAVERGVLDTSPVVHLSERQPEPARKAMSPDEIRTWWRGSDRVPAPSLLALRLLLLTGQRPGEVGGLRVEELDLDASEGPTWYIPADRRKRGLPHAVALTPAAVEVIAEAMKLSDGVHVFVNASGGHVRVDSGMNRALRLIFGGVPGRPTPHAARHTVATEIEDLGFEESDAARVLGHARQGVTGKVYINRRSVATQRVLLEAWGRRLQEILTGDAQAANVVPLRRGK